MRFVDGQDLLKAAVEVEKKKVLAEQRLKRGFNGKLPIAAEAPNEVIF